MSKFNLILDVDSYKFSHFKQYPENTEYVESYIESRGGSSPKILFFGLQYIIKEYLTTPISQFDIDEAEQFSKLHGVPFNKEGWQYILDEYMGYLPIEIEAVPEGYRVPTRNVIAVIRNTDPRCFWLTNYLETMLLRVWYPITVATLSNQIKQVIWDYEIETCDNPETDILFKLHDFSARGCTSLEQSIIGGMSHLINFRGSDTVAGVYGANKYYNNFEMSGFSIPASEHSTITSWGKERELLAYYNFLKKYEYEPVIACVMDSYNIYNACENMISKDLKEFVEKRNGVFVVRPDSGDPVQIVFDLIKIFSKNFGYTVNKKGYKVLNKIRVIQGDGIDINIIKEILHGLKLKGWSCENVNFGMGGALLQKGIHRDTYKFATKCSAVYVKGEGWKDVYKSPVNSFKESKKGRLALEYVEDNNGIISVKTVKREDCKNNLLSTVFYNGELIIDWDLDSVRENTDIIINEL